MQFTISLAAPAVTWPEHFSPALKVAADLAYKGMIDVNFERLKRRCGEIEQEAKVQVERDKRELLDKLDKASPRDNVLLEAAEIEAKTDITAGAHKAKPAKQQSGTRRVGAYSIPSLVEHVMTMPEPFTVTQLCESAPAGLGTRSFFAQLVYTLKNAGYLQKTGMYRKNEHDAGVMLLKRVPGKPYPFKQPGAKS